MNISTRLLVLAGLGVVTAAAVGSVAYVTTRGIAADIQRADVLTTALRNHMEADMMHDALRADVLAARLATDAAEMASVRNDLSEHAATFREQVKANAELPLEPRIASAIADIAPALEAYIASAEKLVALAAKDQKVAATEYPEFAAAFSVLEERNGTVSDLIQQAALENSTQAVTARVHAARQLLFIVAAAGIVGLAGLSVWCIRGIVRPLRAVVTSLRQASESTRASSDQIASASASLAQAASEQAASTQSTSAVSCESATSTRNAARAAARAAEVAQDVRASAEKADESMSRMSEAMNAIDQSARETAAIIKIINEIAFQTNLLALNAAVEAARAGEAGKGFAVVAEEVRSLALRSGEAAQNTSVLIERSVDSARKGNEIAQQVASGLTSINGSIRTVNDLLKEISTAGSEQTDSIERISAAVTQIDELTQQNASVAEESAAAAAELKTQSVGLSDCVDRLRHLVGDRTSPLAV
jgi:methyl-accepting chemotaxis protein